MAHDSSSLAPPTRPLTLLPARTVRTARHTRRLLPTSQGLTYSALNTKRTWVLFPTSQALTRISLPTAERRRLIDVLNSQWHQHQYRPVCACARARASGYACRLQMRVCLWVHTRIDRGFKWHQRQYHPTRARACVVCVHQYSDSRRHQHQCRTAKERGISGPREKDRVRV